MKVVGEEIVQEEVAPEVDPEEAVAEPDSEQTISDETPADEEEEALCFAREMEEDLFGAEKARRDKGGKAPETAAGEIRSKMKEDPAPKPVEKKHRVKVALRKNPTPPRRATRQEKGKSKVVEAEATEDMIPLSRLRKEITIREPTAQPQRSSPAEPAKEKPGAEEPTASGPEEERETIITEETIGRINVTVESYKEQTAEVPATTTAEATNETAEIEAVITTLPILQTRDPLDAAPNLQVIVVNLPIDLLEQQVEREQQTLPEPVHQYFETNDPPLGADPPAANCPKAPIVVVEEISSSQSGEASINQKLENMVQNQILLIQAFFLREKNEELVPRRSRVHPYLCPHFWIHPARQSFQARYANLPCPDLSYEALQALTQVIIDLLVQSPADSDAIPVLH
ncbi:uncharacterized protein LOC127256887 [Andrographis paniculata]|uniref:uncharacterized protein LOC127256887 n=1 Tax=Andrographis paniculata TaxID=175694 RepID=UPI0021E89F0E|nr:uncharacterized protein LOC127256887 [Andrographis paniculata]